MVQSINTAGIRASLLLLRRPHLLMPHMAVQDIRGIPYKKLRQQGIKYLVFDKDNCLTAPYIDHIHPEFKSVWSECLSVFTPSNIRIVSNSAGTSDDPNGQAAQRVEEALGVPVLPHKMKKPGCGEVILESFNDSKMSEIAVIGDRLATDVAMANMNGMLAIWTQNIITSKGDNKMASILRWIEHRSYEYLRNHNVQAPVHPSGISL